MSSQLNVHGNRRRFLRVPFEVRANVRNIEDGTTLKGLETRDISMKGVYCFTKTPFPANIPCAVELLLTGTSSELWMSIEGRVVRTDEDGMGIVFDSMDLDTFIHLKNILYYNSGDPEEIDKELGLKH